MEEVDILVSCNTIRSDGREQEARSVTAVKYFKDTSQKNHQSCSQLQINELNKPICSKDIGLSLVSDVVCVWRCFIRKTLILFCKLLKSLFLSMPRFKR